MRFAISYSCGKDSTLALHRMMKQGHEPVGLIVTMNGEAGRSWFHGVDKELLEKISESLGIPLMPCVCGGEDYHTALERELLKAKELGAACCVFGDIDIQDHFDWCAARCENAGIGYRFPLWQEDREALTCELISLGYHAVIKCINNTLLPKTLLGRPLSMEVLEALKDAGVDVCGENGEYHTVTLAGPLFRYPIAYKKGEIIDFGEYSVIDIRAGKG